MADSVSNSSDRARGDAKRVWVMKIARIGPQGSLSHREGGYQTGKLDQTGKPDKPEDARMQDPALGEQ